MVSGVGCGDNDEWRRALSMSRSAGGPGDRGERGEWLCGPRIEGELVQRDACSCDGAGRHIGEVGEKPRRRGG